MFRADVGRVSECVPTLHFVRFEPARVGKYPPIVPAYRQRFAYLAPLSVADAPGCRTSWMLERV